MSEFGCPLSDLASASWHMQCGQKDAANWLHVRQLFVLYRITGDEYFRQWTMKWRHYDRSRGCQMHAFMVTMFYLMRKTPRYLRRIIQ